MSNLNIFNKLIFIINLLVAVLLLIGYLLPYIPPSSFPSLSVLTLVIPVLIVANIIMTLYWLLLVKRQFWLSGIVLIIGLFVNATLYKIFGKDYKPSPDDFTIMSYNTKRFAMNPIKRRSDKKELLQGGIWKFIQDKNPSIVCFQEFPDDTKIPLDYEYIYRQPSSKSVSVETAILSRYPILHTGNLDFPDTFNNGIYADILVDKDTIRIYNLHMQSLSLDPEISGIQHGDKKKLLATTGQKFEKQEEQVNLFLKSEKSCPYPILVTGDFNNTVFSYTYQKIKGDKFDTFGEVGEGFGRTFTFDVIPLRIDFILGTKNAIEPRHFERFKVSYSDHYPIMATLR
ncbi:MAG: endonuclease [Cytophagaceae bacterium]|nr:endonuclease [Cytophagaceae bacterium]|tara:strand:- start:3440 stop:4468 length:1029 start_codon:yes stop_codon:yes gene_type:complete